MSSSMSCATTQCAQAVTACASIRCIRAHCAPYQLTSSRDADLRLSDATVARSPTRFPPLHPQPKPMEALCSLHRAWHRLHRQIQHKQPPAICVQHQPAASAVRD
ncbi:hypothetical protein RvY_11779 [Ramazzottius varieornatus]|uniref:Uncharacterized protein n=1 Tax=Ramazzottius varieornatus TaxID=947166 RepID=A0A1D1VH96_RAMVA|nr:hypothetical protein RvY_11779 [Ramazzottius varieornatus]